MAVHESLRSAGALLFTLVLSAGCTVFDPGLLPVKPTEPPVDDVCPDGTKRPPEPPEMADTPASMNVPDLEFILKDAILSNPSAALNVDRVCTRQTGLWTCLPPPELERYLGGETPIVPQDGPLGEENQFAREVFSLVNAFFEQEQGSLELTAQIAQGHGYGNPLIRITGYNGTANDPRVTVIVSQAVFTLPGTATEAPEVCVEENPARGGVPHVPHEDDVVHANPALTQCFGEELAPLPVDVTYDGNGIPLGIAGYHPGWEDGTLWSWARHDTFQNRDARSPLVIDDLAYVRDWTLVARLPDNVELKLVGEGQAVLAKFTDAYAVAKLKEDLTGTESDEVLVAGRWSLNALLETASSVGVCPGTPEYSIARRQLEIRSDVRSSRDQEGRDVPCDAFSFGISLTAHRANFREITLGQPIPNVCAEE
jgi:hypothetical protein